MTTPAIRVLVPLAAGVEEIEAVTVIDVLRRAGFEVVAAGADGLGPVIGSRGVVLTPDAALADVIDQAFDLVAVPGGTENTARLRREAGLVELLRRRFEAGEPVAAICAAPQVLIDAGIAPRVALTSHPGVKANLADAGSYREEAVVEDQRVVTSRGAGTAMAWALHLVEMLAGKERRREVEGGLAL